MYRNHKRAKYITQRKQARHRGIDWELTYIQWRLIWAHSGHWGERGKGRCKYCMARLGDKGPYSSSNVKIITNTKNCSEVRRAGKLNPMFGKKHTLETRQKISTALMYNQNLLGYKQTPEHIARRVASKIQNAS